MPDLVGAEVSNIDEVLVDKGTMSVSLVLTIGHYSTALRKKFFFSHYLVLLGGFDQQLSFCTVHRQSSALLWINLRSIERSNFRNKEIFEK